MRPNRPTVDDAAHRAVVQLVDGRLAILLYWPASRPVRRRATFPPHRAKVLIGGRHYLVALEAIAGVVAPASYQSLRPSDSDGITTPLAGRHLRIPPRGSRPAGDLEPVR